MRRLPLHIGALLGALVLACSPPSHAAAPSEILTPPEHRRSADQTYLTFPEWYLVYSPTEYAEFIAGERPSKFPYLGHLVQLWSSYAAVTAAIPDDAPPNPGYHVMIWVIGVSTSLEYAVKGTYEAVIGRLTEATRGSRVTAEDRYAAQVAQEYVDFIQQTPWYRFDFAARLGGLWSEVPRSGPAPLRRWERRYALTTEYALKGIYGWLILHAAASAYEAPLPVTAVLLDHLPPSAQVQLPELEVLQRMDRHRVLVTVPRYGAFKDYASTLASLGADFEEIAGNRGVILLSILAASDWQTPGTKASTGAGSGAVTVLFTQPVLTQPGRERFVLGVDVADLSDLLNDLRAPGLVLEHVYDY